MQRHPSMALQVLKYMPDQKPLEELQGVLTYNGNQRQFYEWKFRIGFKTAVLKEETDNVKRLKIVEKIVQGLSGDPALIARTLGHNALISENGLDELVLRTRKIIFPNDKHEALVLYNAGHEMHGILRRQYGEPMDNFIRRHVRWYEMLLDLSDGDYTVAPSIRGQRMFHMANIDETERKIFKSQFGESTSYITVTQFLRKNFLSKHIEERRKQKVIPGKVVAKPTTWKKFGKWKNTAHLADGGDDDQEAGDDGHWWDANDYDNAGYAADGDQLAIEDAPTEDPGGETTTETAEGETDLSDHDSDYDYCPSEGEAIVHE